MEIFLKEGILFTEEKRSISEGADDSGHSCTIGSEIYLDVSYLHYLHDARRSIGSCLRACRVWSAPYDGNDPPPDKYNPGFLKEPATKGPLARGALRKVAQLPRPSRNAEAVSGNPAELEWDDSYDACLVEASEDGGTPPPPPPPPAEPPKHIQEMRRTATMLVKGSYIEENDFQDDVRVYDLVAKKDSRNSERCELKSRVPESREAQPGPAEEKGPPPALPRNTRNTLDPKARTQADCNPNLQNGAPAEVRDDLLAQYEDLLRTLDTGAGAKPVQAEGEPRKALEEEEEEEDMDFSFIPETPEAEKPHSPFGKFFGGTVGRSQSAPFTGQSGISEPRQIPD